MYSPPTRPDGRCIARLLRWFAASMFPVLIVAMLGLSAKAATQRAIILEINDAIGPAIADYIVRELRTAARSETGLIVLRMDTPGGLDTSMRENHQCDPGLAGAGSNPCRAEWCAGSERWNVYCLC